ncbi:MAG: hypothetical protein EB059_00390 [Alphaproteobacteria bacterium]|nr:hypothetical protein [Alphaproteobacteria bacterium]
MSHLSEISNLNLTDDILKVFDSQLPHEWINTSGLTLEQRISVSAAVLHYFPDYRHSAVNSVVEGPYFAELWSPTVTKLEEIHSACGEEGRRYFLLDLHSALECAFRLSNFAKTAPVIVATLCKNVFPPYIFTTDVLVEASRNEEPEMALQLAFQLMHQPGMMATLETTEGITVAAARRDDITGSQAKFIREGLENYRRSAVRPVTSGPRVGQANLG